MVAIVERTGPPDEELFQILTELLRVVLNKDLDAFIKRQLSVAPDLQVLVAQTVEGRAVGFKLGYGEGPQIFYSWLGGVLPEFRRQGLARQMMDRQHDFCRRQGYQYVRTKARGYNQAMLILNLKAGFAVIGMECGSDGVLKVLLEKKL